MTLEERALKAAKKQAKLALRKKLSEERVIRKYVAKTLHTPLKQVQIERGSMRTWWDWGKRGSATALVENRKFEVSWECLTLTHDGIEFLMLYSPVHSPFKVTISPTSIRFHDHVAMYSS